MEGLLHGIELICIIKVFSFGIIAENFEVFENDSLIWLVLAKPYCSVANQRREFSEY